MVMEERISLKLRVKWMGYMIVERRKDVGINVYHEDDVSYKYWEIGVLGTCSTEYCSCGYL